MRYGEKEFFQVRGAQGYKAPSIEAMRNHGADEITISSIALDASTSVRPFASSLKKMVVECARAVKTSSRSENVLLRYTQFRNDYVQEMHGFEIAGTINPDDYEDINPDGGTPLFRSGHDAISSIKSYGEKLEKDGFTVNGVCYIVTDGGDTSRGRGPQEADIKKLIDDIHKSGYFDSFTVILIGLVEPLPDRELSEDEVDYYNNQRNHFVQILKDFKNKANLTHFIDMGNANASVLAKLSNFIQSSVVVKSKVAGTEEDEDDMSQEIGAYFDTDEDGDFKFTDDEDDNYTW